MIHIIDKMLILLKNHLNYLKDSISQCCFKEYNRILIYFIYLFIYFFTTYSDGNLSLEEENIIKDIRNLFRLKKTNYTAIKDIRNLFRLEKKTKPIKNKKLRDIKYLFKHKKEEQNYYKPVGISNL